MNSEVDLTKQCYQIWHKVAKVAKKVLPEMAKSRQSGQKVPKMEKKGFTVFELPLPEAGQKRAGASIHYLT